MDVSTVPTVDHDFDCGLLTIMNFQRKHGLMLVASGFPELTYLEVLGYCSLSKLLLTIMQTQVGWRPFIEQLGKLYIQGVEFKMLPVFPLKGGK